MNISVAALRVADQKNTEGRQIAARPAQQLSRLDGQRLTLPTRETRGQYEIHMAIVAHLPCVTQIGEARGADSGRIEMTGVDAARHGEDAGGIRLVDAGDARGGVNRIGNDSIAARHHRIVKNFQPRVFMHFGMIGGDEGTRGASRGGQRRPGGRTRPGVDEIDFFARDEARQMLDIERHDDGVFRFDRHVKMFAACGLHFVNKTPAGTDDQRPTTRLDDGTRHVDGCALGPADVERRHDLQDGRTGKG